MKLKIKLLNIFHFLNIASLVTFCSMLFINYSSLPEKIPLHFDFSMKPDRWGEKSSIFIFAGLTLFFNILLYTLIFMKPFFQKRPKLLNIPDKKLFLMLPPEKQEIYWNVINEFFAGLAFLITFLFLNILFGTISISLKETEHLEPISFIASFILIQLFVVIYIIRLLRLPRKLIENNSR